MQRFHEAQKAAYPQALAELRAGSKRSHWMWFIFPQLAGLGHSEMARRYAIADLAEAKAYLRDAVLGARLGACTEAMLRWAGERTAEEILGPIDALKFSSSMTLFEAAGGARACADALEGFYAGHRDRRTLEILETER